MRQFYFLLVCVLCFFNSLAQKEGASRIYGYKQKVMPGTIRVDENGREVRRQQQYNYFIYLASTSKVIPQEIWINGEPFALTIREVGSPVEYTHPTSGDNSVRILVPKTTRIVLQLGPSNNRILKPSKKGKALSLKNEVVIIYKGSGKAYYKSISKLTEMEPVAMQ